MKSKILIGFLLIVFCTKADNYSSCIDKIQKYQSGVRIIRGYKDDYLDPQTFNLDTYLAFFDRLEFDKSKIFDVYYFDNYLDGNPYLYVIDSVKDFDYSVKEYSLNQKLSSTKKALSKSIIYQFLSDSTSRARNFVIPVDSTLGYLQYLYFAEMGEKFALKWHALTRSQQVVCSIEELSSELNNFKDRQSTTLDTINVDGLRNLQIEPIIKSNADNTCSITWIEMRDYGVCRCKYSIEKTRPFRIKLIDEEYIVRINSLMIY